MSKSDDRFYLMEFRNRPVMWGDIGSVIRIQGLVVGGGRLQTILLLPGEEKNFQRIPTMVKELSVEEWSDFIHRSNEPEVLIDGPRKTFQRKFRYEISGQIQQKVWVADGLICRYCRKEMGDVLLTIDHFIPLEMGGKNDTTNYLTSCKPCNKAKGNQDPKIWCEERHLDYMGYLGYLKNRVIK